MGKFYITANYTVEIYLGIITSILLSNSETPSFGDHVVNSKLLTQNKYLRPSDKSL